MPVCHRSGDRDASAGGETHEGHIRSGCSPAVHDPATEVVATGSAPPGTSREATPMNAPFSPSHLIDRPTPDLEQRQRALVLGGGGSTGNAWLIGVIAGLFDAGLDVTEADLIIGTSAGSTAAAQITSASPTQLLADILSAATQQRTGPVGSDGGRVPIGPVADHMERTNRIIAAAEDATDMRRRMGAAASKWMRRRTAPGK